MKSSIAENPLSMSALKHSEEGGFQQERTQDLANYGAGPSALRTGDRCGGGEGKIDYLPAASEKISAHSNRRKKRGFCSWLCCVSDPDEESEQPKKVKGYTGKLATIRGGTLAQQTDRSIFHDPVSITRAGPYHSMQMNAKKADDQSKWDFYRRFYMMVVDRFKPEEIQSMEDVQLRFFLPVLLQIPGLQTALMHRLRLNKSLRAERYFWQISNPDPVHADYKSDLAVLRYEFGPTEAFFEDILNSAVNDKIEIGQELLPDGVDCMVPLQDGDCVLTKTKYVKRFASGHAPILVEATYLVEEESDEDVDDNDDVKSLKMSTKRISYKETSPKKVSLSFKLKGRESKGHQKKRSQWASKSMFQAADRRDGADGAPRKLSSPNRSQLRIRSAEHRRAGSAASTNATSENDSALSCDPDIIHSKTTSLLLKPDAVCRAAGVSRMMHLFNYLWSHSWLRKNDTPQALCYMVIPGGPNWGFIELLQDAEPIKTFDFKTVEQWIQRTESFPTKGKYKEIRGKVNKFFKSVVGGCVAGHLLGLRDRHSDNILISSGYKMYHIDFKHCFNIKTKVVDAPSMVVPDGLYNLLVNTDKWDWFVNACVDAFTVLRRSAQALIRISALIFAGQVDAPRIEQSYINAFKLGMTEKRARQALAAYIRKLPGCFKHRVKELIHNRSPNLRDSRTGRGLETKKTLAPLKVDTTASKGALSMVASKKLLQNSAITSKSGLRSKISRVESNGNVEWTVRSTGGKRSSKRASRIQTGLSSGVATIGSPPKRASLASGEQKAATASGRLSAGSGKTGFPSVSTLGTGQSGALIGSNPRSSIMTVGTEKGAGETALKEQIVAQEKKLAEQKHLNVVVTAASSQGGKD